MQKMLNPKSNNQTFLFYIMLTFSIETGVLIGFSLSLSVSLTLFIKTQSKLPLFKNKKVNVHYIPLSAKGNKN